MVEFESFWIGVLSCVSVCLFFFGSLAIGYVIRDHEQTQKETVYIQNVTVVEKPVFVDTEIHAQITPSGEIIIKKVTT